MILISTNMSILVSVIGGIIGFFICTIAEKLPISKQLEKVKNWLVFAVTAAEKIYGEKLGILKLEYVYQEFTKVFPKLVNKLSFDEFSKLVDGALEVMKNLRNSNKKLDEYITNEPKEDVINETNQ